MNSVLPKLDVLIFKVSKIHKELLLPACRPNAQGAPDNNRAVGVGRHAVRAKVQRRHIVCGGAQAIYEGAQRRMQQRRERRAGQRAAVQNNLCVLGGRQRREGPRTGREDTDTGWVVPKSSKHTPC